jgi:hypothetical protein
MRQKLGGPGVPTNDAWHWPYVKVERINEYWLCEPTHHPITFGSGGHHCLNNIMAGKKRATKTSGNKSGKSNATKNSTSTKEKPAKGLKKVGATITDGGSKHLSVKGQVKQARVLDDECDDSDDYDSSADDEELRRLTRELEARKRQRLERKKQVVQESESKDEVKMCFTREHPTVTMKAATRVVAMKQIKKMVVVGGEQAGKAMLRRMIARAKHKMIGREMTTVEAKIKINKLCNIMDRCQEVL